MLIIELNEFNAQLLIDAAAQFKLPNIAHLMSFNHSMTNSPEKNERYGLDPWVQWVSIHTGAKAKEHKIWHLAEADKLELDQIWEKLAEGGLTYGVWGVMNARYRKNDACKFFFPDPWTYTEKAYPASINNFLSLPRYYAKNYLDLRFFTLIKESLKTLKFLTLHLPSLISFFPAIFSTLIRCRFNSVSLFASFDLINAALFSHFRKRYDPKFCIIFLNTMAHFQHHCWPKNNRLSKKNKSVLELIDKAVGTLMANCDKNEPIILINAFTQENTAELNETLYRQKDPESFFRKINLPSCTVEQLMTNDSQLIFSSETDRNLASDVIKSAEINGKQVFDVQIREDDKLRFFCQFNYWGPLSKDLSITFNNGIALPFYQHFEAIVKRTGSHVRNGDIFSKNIQIPRELMNYELAKFIGQHYGINA